VNEREKVDVLASAGIEDVNDVCPPFDDAFDQLAIARAGVEIQTGTGFGWTRGVKWVKLSRNRCRRRRCAS